LKRPWTGCSRTK